jgi:hypothetical protein
MSEPAKIRNVAVVGHRGTGKGSSRRSSLPVCRPGVEGALLTVSAVMRVERMGPVAARHSPPGPAGLDIRRYTLSPSHSADLPPADDADDDVARRECQTRPQWGRACFADALLPARPSRGSHEPRLSQETTLSRSVEIEIHVAGPLASPILRPRCESPARTCVCRVRTRRDKESTVRARPMSDVAVAEVQRMRTNPLAGHTPSVVRSRPGVGGSRLLPFRMTMRFVKVMRPC